MNKDNVQFVLGLAHLTLLGTVAVASSSRVDFYTKMAVFCGGCWFCWRIFHSKNHIVIMPLVGYGSLVGFLILFDEPGIPIAYCIAVFALASISISILVIVLIRNRGSWRFFAVRIFLVVTGVVCIVAVKGVFFPRFSCLFLPPTHPAVIPYEKSGLNPLHLLLVGWCLFAVLHVISELRRNFPRRS